MNIAMEQTEEYVNGQLKNKYGDCFIRGNNGEFCVLCLPRAVPGTRPVGGSILRPFPMCSALYQHGSARLTDMDSITAIVTVHRPRA